MMTFRKCSVSAKPEYVRWWPFVINYLMNTDEPEALRHFTERRLRPLTLLASDEDKILKFIEIKRALAIKNTSEQRVTFEALKSG